MSIPLGSVNNTAIFSSTTFCYLEMANRLLSFVKLNQSWAIPTPEIPGTAVLRNLITANSKWFTEIGSQSFKALYDKNGLTINIADYVTYGYVLN